MEVYQIQVFDDDGKTALIASESQHNDSAAICAAKAISGRNKFEVWRGLECVYAIGQNAEPNSPALETFGRCDRSGPLLDHTERRVAGIKN